MDSLSSSVLSTLKVPTLVQYSNTTREVTHFKTNHTTASININNSNNNVLYYSNSKPTNNKTTTTSFTTNPTVVPSASSSSTGVHRDPATGYAVALLDMAQQRGAVEVVGKDVVRLLKVLGLGEREKGRLVLDMAEKGRFGFGGDSLVTKLVKMLVRKNKSGIVKRVLEEFVRVYDQMLLGYSQSDDDQVELGFHFTHRPSSSAMKIIGFSG